MLTNRRRAAPRRVDVGSDAGLTLMELMIAMTLTTVLGVITLTFFLTSNRVSTQTVASTASTASARVALDTWVGLLQTTTVPSAATPEGAGSDNAPPAGGQMIVSLTPTSIRFFSNISNRNNSDVGASTKIDLKWVREGSLPACPTTTSASGCLVEITYLAADAATAASTRVLLTRVVPGASTATGACGDSAPIGGAPDLRPYAAHRLLTACDNVNAQTVSADCAAPCTSPPASTTEDTGLLKNDTTSTAPPSATSVVVAFTASTVDANGATRNQQYVSVAALTGQLTRGIDS